MDPQDITPGARERIAMLRGEQQTMRAELHAEIVALRAELADHVTGEGVQKLHRSDRRALIVASVIGALLSGLVTLTVTLVSIMAHR